MTRPRATFAMSSGSLVPQFFRPDLLDELRRHVDVDPRLVLTELDSDAARRTLAATEILLAGWGAPVLTRADDAPRLRAVVYAGGVAATCLEDPRGLAARGVRAANARAANAVPVAEFALAMILLSNKAVFRAERMYRERRAFFDRATELTDTGNHRRTVGIVGASTIGRALIRLLRPFDLDVVVYSPELTPALAAELGVRAAGLDEVMAAGDVVSLHQPLTPETTGQIDARRLALMRDGATLLNTARGAVVDHEALLAELRSGRIRAVLDVTEPQPLPPGSPFFDLPNVVLTPHVAGSMGGELHRIGESVVAEVARFVAGEPFAHPERLDEA
ncbi:hydroxyacid dehydrogenase [Streptomyces regalis]|uniref:Hydroxyacid dehydrogenase n=1 Tax=Streptomyces regalis TaxID=68262 RepID=A0A101JSZ4_9ACTN|nr:hydroxyacid dehydrogenase [Streptomyces regalis]KUL32148.1 hydroxyacid dehydrogenase [Streptomyces regalis]